MQNINEEYYGKSPELEQVAREFDKLIEKYNTIGPTFDPLSSKENAQIQKLIEKMFGLKNFWLYWIPTRFREAYTDLDGTMFGGSYFAAMHRRNDGKGFYDRSHRVVIIVYIGTGLLDKACGLTGDELTAVILHEIGHNFDVAPYSALNYILEISEKDEEEMAKRDTIKIVGWETMDAKNRQEGADKLRRTDDEYNTLWNNAEDDALKRYLEGPGILSKFVQLVFNCLSLGVAVISSPFIQIMGSYRMGKQMEIFADSFATAYGFGPELSSGLEKLMSYAKAEKQLGVRKRSKAYMVLDDLNAAIVEIVYGYAECHGSNIERTKDCIVKLKRDAAAADCPPKMKAQIFEEIERLQKQLDIMIYGDPNKKKTIQNRVRIISEKLFGSRFGIVWRLMRRRQA